MIQLHQTHSVSHKIDNALPGNLCKLIRIEFNQFPFLIGHSVWKKLSEWNECHEKSAMVRIELFNPWIRICILTPIERVCTSFVRIWNPTINIYKNSTLKSEWRRRLNLSVGLQLSIYCNHNTRCEVNVFYKPVFHCAIFFRANKQNVNVIGGFKSVYVASQSSCFFVVFTWTDSPSGKWALDYHDRKFQPLLPS